MFRLSSHLPSSCRPSWCSGALAFTPFRSTFSSISNLGQTPNHVNSKIFNNPSQQNNPQSPLVETTIGEVDINTFRRAAWVPKTPLLLQGFHSLPAINNWFQNDTSSSFAVFSPSMKQYEDMILPYEFTVSHLFRDEPNPEGDVLSKYLKWLRGSSEYKDSYVPVLVEALMQSSDSAENPKSTISFQQFEAPLSLIMSACQFNLTRENPAERIKHIYVAQSDLSHLPEPLFRDLPTPDIIKQAGKGDIYSSSIWLGLQPTYTPLHRDPNPNLFCQLVGSKRIRLMTPDLGDDIYARVRRELGSHGSSRFRGTEMMRGRERELLHRAVWDNDTVSEVLLNPRDALFIPTGWWHSVASDGTYGQLNSSVNWWFR